MLFTKRVIPPEWMNEWMGLLIRPWRLLNEWLVGEDSGRRGRGHQSLRRCRSLKNSGKKWQKILKTNITKKKSVGRGGGDTRASEDADRDSEDKYSAKTNLGKNANKILKKQNYKKISGRRGRGHQSLRRCRFQLWKADRREKTERLIT